MAYFANSTEGEILDRQCEDCFHADEEVGCPVALVQMVFNYDQLREGHVNLKEAMAILVNDDGICQVKRLIDQFYRRKTTETERPKYKESASWGD